MATRAQDISRFCINYQKFIILIVIVLAIQIFLAIRVVLLPGSWDVISGDGSKGPYYKKLSPRMEVEEGRNEKLNLESSPTQPNVPTQSAIKSAVTLNTSFLTLDLDSLTFVPECNITSKDSISAINRAKTQRCKEEIASLSCQIASDNLYVKRLPRLCKNEDKVYGNYVGCFKDTPKNRLLTGHLSLFKDSNSPQTCIDLCLQSGFQYAGLQYGVECFCGNTKPTSSVQVDDAFCDIKCPEEGSGTNDIESANFKGWDGNCGGYFTMNVFETGVFQDYVKNKIIGLNGEVENGRIAEKPEKTVRVVFFLTLNGRSIRQTFRLIKALFHEKHFFYIHVDSRQDYLYRELLALTRTISHNVRFMANRKATIWGGASLLTVLLDGMEDLIVNAETWNWNWDYVVNLSESDFPLKTTEKLEEFLSHNNGRNFVKSHGRDVQKFIQKQGLDKTFFECEHRMWRVGDRKLPKGVMIDGGSDWIALHRNFIDYIIKTGDELVSGLKTVFKYTLLPAESFFHTVLRNSEHCLSFVDNNLHVTNWKRKLGCKCQYRNVVDWCGCSPNDFRLSDWNRLLLAESRILFFGRKFEAIVNQAIINNLESWLYPDRFDAHYPTLDRFWLSLYHHHDLSPKPDDCLVTLGLSLARIAARKFATKYNCTIITPAAGSISAGIHNDTTKLIELTAYNHDDHFEGVLVRFTSDMTKQISYAGAPEASTIALEAWFRPENHVTIAPWSKQIARYRSKIKDIQIGTEYDQKEQIFRNLARCIGPFSEPVLTYNIVAEDPFNITAVFIDPTNSVQGVVNGSAGDGSGNIPNFIKPSLKTPLLPGKWNVKLLTLDGYLLAELKMVVLPLEIYQGKPISETNMQQINGKQFSDEVDQREHVQDWIDGLVNEFYIIQDNCLESEQSHILLSKWKTDEASNIDGSHGQSGLPKRNKDAMDVIDTSMCSHVQWSSLFPDPKSMITGIDSETGRLLP